MTPESGNPLEEEMATHSSVLTWETPWTEEPGGLPSMGSQGDTTEPTAHQGSTQVGRRHEESGPGWPDPCPSPDCPSALGSLGSKPGTRSHLRLTDSWAPAASFPLLPADIAPSLVRTSQNQRLEIARQPLLRVPDVWFW